jgi:hypothetical protein
MSRAKTRYAQKQGGIAPARSAIVEICVLALLKRAESPCAIEAMELRQIEDEHFGVLHSG